jgi:DNA-binding SARP family transcriptional activator/tetratricopeptide (TPR) repeat protein
MAVEIRLLGPVEVWADGRRLAGLGTTQQRAVLAALAVDAGRPVLLQTLVDRVWDEAPPAGTRPALYAHISRIRHALHPAGAAGHRPPSPVCRRAGGYVLDIDPDRIDLHRFRRLTAAGGRPGCSDAERAGLLGAALEQWHGPPLADLSSQWALRMRDSWSQQRLDVVFAWALAQLRLGRHDTVIGPVRDLLADHPLAEPLVGVMMRALAARGRDAEALARYAATRTRLRAELGAEPGPELRAVHEAILRRNVSGTVGSPRAESTGSEVDRSVPAQLPADVAGFTGRAEELAELDRLCGITDGTDRSTGASPAVVISAVSGTAGVGKTALAVHWAHRVADRFPDGQLCVNLRGFDPDQPMSPADALAGFLVGLGVAGRDIPVELEDRAARYRTETAGRRLLVVLDNASSVDQVRPLLPGTPTATVLVTGRDSLPGLIALHGARRLDLDLLPLPDAIALLRTLIGRRVEADPGAAAELARQCARLPLALRVAAELAAARPTAPLAELVAELTDQQQRLDLLDGGGDPRAAVGPVFSWSLQHLPADAVRLFRLLGPHPGPDLDPYAAAALANTTTALARRMLDTLARAHLVQPVNTRRYGMHDLLRAYATSLTTAADRTEGLRAAYDRLFDYYLATAAAAMNTLHPAEANRRPDVPTPSTPTPGLTDPVVARAWLDAERRTLVAVAAHTANHGWPTHTIRLSSTLFRYLGGGHHTEALTIHGHACQAAHRTGDLAGHGHALTSLGTTHMQTGRGEAAAEHLHQALHLFRQAGDPSGEARALNNLGNVEQRLGHNRRAVDHIKQALALNRQAGDLTGEARALINLGTAEVRLGCYQPATDHYAEALTLFRRLGNRDGQAGALSDIGYAEVRLGRHAPAAEHLRQALTLHRRAGNRQGEAWALDSLGALHIRLGQPTRSTEHYQQALAIFGEIGQREGEAWALNGLGEAAHAAGRPADARRHHTAALTVTADTGARDQQARAHTGLGHAHAALAEPSRARQHYRQALALYIDLGVPEADDIRAHLATVEPTGDSDICLDGPSSNHQPPAHSHQDG